MSADLNQAISSLYAELGSVEARSLEIKKMINNLSAMLGESLPFSNVETTVGFGNQSIKPDQFFGKGLSTAVKEYLKMKNQACTAQEIFDALRAGGFEFSKDWGEKFQLRNLTISLSKNRNDFVFVKSSNAYGLWEFYPDKKRERQKIKGQNGSDVPIDENPGPADPIGESVEEEQK
jgi:hypothetical protein